MNFRVGQYLKFTKKKKIARVTNIDKWFVSLRYYTYNKAEDGYSGGMTTYKLINLFKKEKFIFISSQKIIKILMKDFYGKKKEQSK